MLFTIIGYYTPAIGRNEKCHFAIFIYFGLICNKDTVFFVSINSRSLIIFQNDKIYHQLYFKYYIYKI